MIMEPFKGLALGVFLITIGMSIDPGRDQRQYWARWRWRWWACWCFKALITGILLRLMGARRSTAAETGVMMASPSEKPR